MLKSLLNGSRFLVFAAVLGALAVLVHKIMVLLKSPKNASTRLSMNGKIPNDFKRPPFVTSINCRLGDWRRINGGFSRQNQMMKFENDIPAEGRCDTSTLS